MTDFEPRLRPIEPAPLTPLRERRPRGNGRSFDLERELGGGERQDDPTPDARASDASDAPDVPDAPVAPRADDEAGGHLDVIA